MPVSKKKGTTSESVLSTSHPSCPLPEQQEFHQHLRALAQSAVRYPEAVRGLMEDEEHLLTFYALTREHAPTHSDHERH